MSFLVPDKTTHQDDIAAAKNRANHTGTQPASTITGLANVATSGDYNDLDNLPDLTGAVSSVAGKTGAVNLVKTDVGLSNVDNTSDAAKPISSAQAAVNAAKADLVGGLIPTSQIPALALNTVVTVASRSAMLALTSSQVQPGDVAVDTSSGGTRGSYMLLGADPSTIGNWVLLNAPTDTVGSVNGQTGTVVLAATDVGAAPASLTGTVAGNTTAIGQLSLGNTATTLTASGAMTANGFNLLDATSGALTATLPTPTRVGQLLTAERVDSTTNLISFAGTIRGVAATATMPGLGVAGETFLFVAESLTSWRIAATHKPTALLTKQFGRAHLVFTQPEIGGVGDGITDNTDAWNRAMNLLEVAGGKLEFPVGIYCIAGTTQPVPGASLLVGTGLNYGAADGTAPEGVVPSRGAIIRATAAMTRLIQLGRNPGTSAQADTGASMRDLIVDGRNVAATVVQTAGRRNYIRDCQIYWGTTYGVDFQGQNSYLIGGVVDQNNKGTCVNVANYYDHKIFDAQLRLPGTGGNCIRILSGDVLVRGNHIWSKTDTGGPTVDAIIYVAPSAYNVGIVDNIIEAAFGPEVKVAAGAKIVSVTGNIFFSSPSVPGNTYDVITLNGTGTDPLNDVTIANNIVRGVATYASFVNFTGTFSSTERILIHGNVGQGLTTMQKGTPPNVPIYGPNAFGTTSGSVLSTNKGVATFSGDGSTTTFAIATSLPSPPKSFSTTAGSAAAAVSGRFTGVSGNNLIVTFTTAPPSGTNNVVVAWEASVAGVATTTAAADQIAPTVPGTPTASGQSAAIALTWTASTDNVAVAGYHVYRSDNPNTAIGTTTSNAYSDGTAVIGTAYTYTVDAYDAVGNTSAKSASSNSATAAAVSNFVADSFAGTIGANLTSRSGETGATWTNLNSVGAVVLSNGNRARRGTSGLTVHYASGVPASADYTVEADMFVKSLLGGSTAGIIIRQSTTENTGYVFRYAVTSGTYTLQKFIASTTNNQIIGSPYTPGTAVAVNEQHRLRVTIAGSTITCYVDGVQILTGTDTDITAAGRAGMMWTGSVTESDTTGLHLDNFIAHP